MLELTGQAVSFSSETYTNKKTNEPVTKWVLEVATRRGTLKVQLTDGDARALLPAQGQGLQRFGTLVVVEVLPDIAFENFQRVGGLRFVRFVKVVDPDGEVLIDDAPVPQPA